MYVIIMSRTRFRVNLHFIVASMSRNSLLETGAMSDVLVTTTRFEPTTSYFLNQHSTSWPVWLNGWVFVYELSGSEFAHCCHLISSYLSLYTYLQIFATSVCCLRPEYPITVPIFNLISWNRNPLLRWCRKSLF